MFEHLEETHTRPHNQKSVVGETYTYISAEQKMQGVRLGAKKEILQRMVMMSCIPGAQARTHT